MDNRTIEQIRENEDVLIKLIEAREQEIERLNNIINELSKENQELKEKTKLFHKNGVFSLEYDKETLRDMVLEYQEEIERLNNIINEAIEYINENWGHWCSNHYKYATKTINILKGSDSNE